MNGEMTPTQYEWRIRGLIDTGLDDGVDLSTIKEALLALLDDCVCPMAKTIVQKVLTDMRGNEPLKFQMKGISQ